MPRFLKTPSFNIFVYSTVSLNLKRYIIPAFFGFLTFHLRSQDIHFSQFTSSLLNLSPAYTGFFEGDYRIGAIYRSQWQSVPVSYSTFSMNGEKRFRPRARQNDAIGAGILFNNDRAGDARYGSTQLYASGSYIFMAKPDGSLLISLGMNMGWCQVGFDYEKMTFDNQFDGLQYNQSLGSGETFGFTRRNFFDMNVGTVVQYIHEEKHKFTYGLGVHHLTGPVISYQGNDLSRLDYKITNCLAYTTPIGENTDIIAEALLSNQGRNYELIPHASLKYFFDRDENKAILGGACLRSRDAVILRLGYTQGTLQSGISYDINISRFTPATNRRGGIELFVNYIIKVKPGFIAKKRYCPVSM